MSLPPLPDVPRERRQTSTRVAVVALGLLCLLALVLGLRGLLAPADSRTSSGATPQPGTTSAEQSGGAAATPSNGPATPSPTSTASPDGTIRFVSPTGNIRCVVSTQGARCDIIERDWEPPAKPSGCRQQWGPGLYVNPRTSGVVCADDRVQGGSALEYGDAVTRGDFRCDSDEDGMRCVNTRTQRGFTISRGSFQLS